MVRLLSMNATRNMSNKMINCGSLMKGVVTLTLLDKNGVVKHQQTVTNKIVYDGTVVIASLLSGTPLPLPSHMACGVRQLDPEQNQDPALNDEQLENEVALVPLDGPGVHSENGVTFTATFGPNIPAEDLTAVQEVGIWCINPTNPDEKYLFNRAVFSVVNKTRDDTVIVNWVVTVLSDDATVN